MRLRTLSCYQQRKRVLMLPFRLESHPFLYACLSFTPFLPFLRVCSFSCMALLPPALTTQAFLPVSPSLSLPLRIGGLDLNSSSRLFYTRIDVWIVFRRKTKRIQPPKEPSSICIPLHPSPRGLKCLTMRHKTFWLSVFAPFSAPSSLTRPVLIPPRPRVGKIYLRQRSRTHPPPTEEENVRRRVRDMPKFPSRNWTWQWLGFVCPLRKSQLLMPNLIPLRWIILKYVASWNAVFNSLREHREWNGKMMSCFVR